MQNYNKRPRPYRAFNYSNSFYKPIYKKTFPKKVSFTNKNYEYCPPNHVPKYCNYSIKTKNRFEGLSLYDNEVHQDDDNSSYNDFTQIKSKNNFKSKKLKYGNIVTNEDQSKEMEELTRHMIEKGPLTITSDKDIKCFYVSDLLKVYEKIPVGGKMVHIDGKLTPKSHQLPVQLVLDSGSSVSIISGRTMNKLKRLGIYPSKTHVNLIAASPHKTKINEIIELPIEISDGNQTLELKSQFLVCDYLQFEVLIGNNILDRYLNKLDYKNRYAEFNDSNMNTIEIPFNNNKIKRSNIGKHSNPVVLSSWLY